MLISVFSFKPSTLGPTRIPNLLHSPSSNTKLSKHLLHSSLCKTATKKMTQHTPRIKRRFFRSSVPKALKLFSLRAAKRTPTSEDLSSSPTSFTRSSTGKGSTHRRLEDRSRSSFDTSTSDEYVERFSLSPQQDPQLAFEITRRQNSSVRAKITRYDQLNAKSKMPPVLKQVQGKPLSRFSQIYERVQSFEKIDADGKYVPGPSLEEMRQRRENTAHRSRSFVVTALYTL